MPARRGRNLRAYRRKSARLKRTDSTCHLCGKPIDTTLDYRHPMSFTADHVTPLAAGGHILGPLLPAHRSCNSSKGAGRSVKPTRRASRAW